MSCPITLAGILSDCNGQGGVKKIFIIDSNKVESVTVDSATEIITNMTITAGSEFVEYSVRKQVANITSTLTVNDVAGSVFCETVLTASFPKMNASKRLELKALSLGTLVVLVEDNNGVFWLMGHKHPVTMTTGGGATGTNFGDANQFTITLSSISDTLPYEVDSTFALTLI